jgi:ATP-binding cassette subfamily B protein
MVWRTSPQLTAASLVLRLVRAVLPVITLFVGKLIIDDVVVLVQMPHKPETLRQWLNSSLLNWLGLLLLAEFALAVLADILGRIVSLVDSLLSERVTNSSSVRLMEHAATLDLEDFEDSEFQDQIERARRQTSGRMTLMGQLFGQVQDMVTVASSMRPGSSPCCCPLWFQRSSERRISMRKAIRSISYARQSGANLTMLGRPPPASKRPRK